MKRALGFIFVTVACIAAFLSVRGTLPFIPIFGNSMEPTLHSGSLLTINEVDPQDIEVGDIIVYKVPELVREYYNYPTTVAHRVTKIYDTSELTFRTKGDNTGNDPFTIRPQDILGTVGDQIPYLGLPMLFFQSQQGMIFIFIALALLAIYLYGGELSRGGNFLHRGVFAPVINEEKRANRMLSRKIEATEQKMNSTEQALEKFAAAVAEYAQHLASHTSAIQGLAEASHELKRGAAEQNMVLARILEATGQGLPVNVNPPPAPETMTATTMPPARTATPPRMEIPLNWGTPTPGTDFPAPACKEPAPQPRTANTAAGTSSEANPPGCACHHSLSPETIMAELRKHQSQA